MTAVAPALERERLVPRLGARARRVLLITHLAAAGAWLGMDVALGALVVAALGAPPATAAAMAQATGAFVGWPLVAAALLTLGSGIVLGLGSKYGVLRYWWVATKLVITVVLLGLVIGVLIPGVVELVATASASNPDEFALDARMLYPPIVSTTVLVATIAISVVKPWGRR